jgi:molybdopterin synthase catalytic subunit/molybdopterin converting factor small subunit
MSIFRTMQVRVLVFGVLKDLLPGHAGLVSLPAGSSVHDLLQQLRPAADNDRLWQSIAVAVNREYVPSERTLSEGDEVALLPPVSGGTDTSRIELTRNPIDASQIVSALKQGEDGAVVVFDGIVRNHTRRRKTLFLVYEAYEEMALPQMQKFDIRDLAIVHRLGHLNICETSVLIAVASAHRAAAFDACRWLIDTLKKTVPIWKKEHFEDGAVWSDGEPFPPELIPRPLPTADPEPSH